MAVRFEQKEKDVYDKFEFRSYKAISFILYKVINRKLEVVALGAPESTFDDFKSKIMEFGNDGGLYCLRAFMFNGQPKHVLVRWSPNSLPGKEKMLYASGLAAFFEHVGDGYHNVLVATESELDEEAIISQIEML